MIAGITSTVIHAPSTNFAVTTTKTVVAVASDPSPLTSIFRRDLCASGSLPVRDHSGLGKREWQESAHGIERNQPVRYASEDDQQDSAHYGERPDAVGIHEAPAASAEAAWEVAILSNSAAKPRKICKSRIGRERQHQQDGSHGNVVERPLAGHGSGELREDASIAGLSRIGGADVIGTNQESDSPQHGDENRDDGRQGSLRRFRYRLPEGLDAVTDRLNPGHRSTATGKGFKQ